jgi:hypothetical protein
MINIKYHNIIKQMSDYSDQESVDTDFEEQSARELADFILENDVKFYRKFRPEVKKLDSKSFKNMFSGNKNYNYNIRNKIHFNQLVTKFENFKFLLEEWYEDKDTYIYIKQLWEKYISIESLKDKKEEEIENFLTEKKINYASWPQRIKDQFLNIIQNTKNTIIFTFKQSYQKLPNLMKSLLNNLYNFSEYCREKGNKLFSNLSKNQLFILAKHLFNIDINNFPSFANIILQSVSSFEKKTLEFAIENGSYLLNINPKNYSDILKGEKGPTLGASIYSIMAFYNLYNSYNNYENTKSQMSKINGYEKKIDEIELDFEMHRKKIEDLSNNKALNLLEYNSELENCVKLIREDKEKIIKIIEEIKKLIDQNNEQKKDKILDIAGSVVKVGIGIIGGLSVKGVSSLINFGGAIMNGGSAILDALTINKLNENIAKLEIILAKAKTIESKIDNELKKLKELIEENADAAPTFC